MFAQVAELVDAHVSGACVERRAGSTPVLGTCSIIELERWRNGRRAALRWQCREAWEFESPPLHFLYYAEIAQLVEHNLAKVGVASSSLVFRSRKSQRNLGLFLYPSPTFSNLII